ncbi:hypothetical protein WN48_02325 [Eufriesea mexicana]|uniref:Uncharacterized protein n=1 Tax=Eufriesea mexicana TaxID=516756 RepID=A0A310SQJ2_9HYME|nr:hypothetical protein WN48_02325 [Eufriesea mexicana]
MFSKSVGIWNEIRCLFVFIVFSGDVQLPLFAHKSTTDTHRPFRVLTNVCAWLLQLVYDLHSCVSCECINHASGLQTFVNYLRGR